MLDIRHILYPVDFSERCASIQPFVREMAARHNAKVTLLHAMQIPATFYPAMETAYVMDLDLTEMIGEAEEKLAEFYNVPRHALPNDVEMNVATGDPPRSIVDFAESHHVDLIMLPTHGYGRYRALLLGSVAAKVLHDAKCPVWTASHTENPVLAEHVKCESILCAIDLKPGSKELLWQSVDFAKLRGAKLRIVHAVPGADDGAAYMGNVPGAEFRSFLLRAAREEIARIQHDAGTRLEVCVEAGSACKTVRLAAEHHRADIVFIGRGKLDCTLGRLRTHSYSIIRDSPCPVISLPCV